MSLQQRTLPEGRHIVQEVQQVADAVVPAVAQPHAGRGRAAGGPGKAQPEAGSTVCRAERPGGPGGPNSSHEWEVVPAA